MNKIYTTGLGEPQPAGKRILFQPPRVKEDQSIENADEAIIEQVPRKRLRTTIELTPNALEIIQGMQNRHRLETGRVLPLWKLVSEVIEKHGKSTCFG